MDLGQLKIVAPVLDCLEPDEANLGKGGVLI